MTQQTKDMVIAEVQGKLAGNESFTAFDITMMMRAAGHTVLHYEVREVVHNYMDTIIGHTKTIDNTIPGNPWRYSFLTQPTLQGQPVNVSAKGNFADQLSSMVKDVGKKAVDILWGPDMTLQQLAHPTPTLTQASALTKLHHPKSSKVVKRSNRGRLWVSINPVAILAATLNSINLNDIKIAVMEGVNKLELLYPPFQAASKTYTFDPNRKGIKISKELLDRVFGSSATRFKIEEKSDGLVLTKV